ncbi:MAG TPA: response regulator transcription factor [Gemmatimonadales bacterium]|nr:response regulator transcription factor [Gemmatimonadales bacterium]
MIRTVLVDGLALVRGGVRTLLHGAGDISVVAEGTTAEEALHLTTELKPDVLLLDQGIPGVLQTVRTVKERNAACEVVVLTNLMHPTDTARVMNAGATGYVCKDIPPDALIEMLRSICSPALPQWDGVPHRPFEFAVVARRSRVGGHGLTSRELDILAELASGGTDQEIAEKLLVGEGTVKTHVRHILHKLGVRNRTAAIAYALRTRVID